MDAYLRYIILDTNLVSTYLLGVCALSAILVTFYIDVHALSAILVTFYIDVHALFAILVMFICLLPIIKITSCIFTIYIKNHF